MKFQERNKPGKDHRFPMPEIYYSEKDQVLLVAMTWGASHGGKRAIERAKDYFQAASLDREATSPFPKLEQYSSRTNNLRISTLLANELLFREDNQKEYITGVEFTAIQFKRPELSIIQYGGPYCIYQKAGQRISVLSNERNSAFLHGMNSPLPKYLLGVQKSPDLRTHSYVFEAGDKLLLIASNQLPLSIFQEGIDWSFEVLEKLLMNDLEDQAYWLGLLEF